MPKALNAAPFNTPTFPWNLDPPPMSPGIARQIVRPPVATPGPTNKRPTIRTTFGVTAEDFAAQSTPETVNKASPVQSSIAFGCFTAIRAAQVLHQYDIDFWGTSGIIAMVATASEPDPTQDQLAQMYQDLLLFSYLPDSMMPTQAEFNDLATPSKRAAVITANLQNMGIITTPSSQNDATVVDETAIQLSSLPAPVPYVGNINEIMST